jgi:hypothetical protein
VFHVKPNLERCIATDSAGVRGDVFWDDICRISWASVIRGHRHSAAASHEEQLSFAQAASTIVCDRLRASATRKIED